RVLGAANLARARRARDGIRADEAAGEERPSRRADAHLGADAIRIVDTGIGSTARLRARADLAAIRIRVAAAEAHDAVLGETVVGDGAANARIQFVDHAPDTGLGRQWVIAHHEAVGVSVHQD